MNETLVQLLPAAIGLLVLGVLAGLAALTKFLLSKSSESKAARVGAVLSDAARAVVLELDTTLKADFKAAASDGKITKEEGEQLKEAALKLLKERLPGGLLSLAKGVFGALTETVLSSVVESAVKEVKAVEALTKHAEKPKDDPDSLK